MCWNRAGSLSLLIDSLLLRSIVCAISVLREQLWLFTSENTELKHAMFLRHGRTPKCTVFLFYLCSYYHIYIFKSLCASKDDYLENPGETNVLACKMFTSGCRPWLKNVACLSSLMPESGYCTRCNSTCLGLVRLSVMRVQRTSTKFEGNSTGKEKGKERNFI